MAVKTCQVPLDVREFPSAAYYTRQGNDTTGDGRVPNLFMLPSLPAFTAQRTSGSGPQHVHVKLPVKGSCTHLDSTSTEISSGRIVGGFALCFHVRPKTLQ